MVDYYRGGPPTTLPAQNTRFEPAPASTSSPSRTHLTAQPSQSQSKTRTTSSSALPYRDLSAIPAPAPNSAKPIPSITPKATMSTATTMCSMSSGSPTYGIQRQVTTSTSTSGRRQSTSSRSSSTPTSYVALMRKQKATVWCDRSQNIDLKVAAAQKAAKQRADMEVLGGAIGPGRASTVAPASMVGKIRHHGVPKAPGYVPANMSGAGVPLRLSANEMLGDEDEGRSVGDTGSSINHTRSGSGRSSTHSAKYPSGYPRPGPGRFSSNSTPPSEGEDGSPHRDIPELTETPGAGQTDHRHEYFDTRKTTHTSTIISRRSESEDSFGDVKEMKAPSAAKQATQQASKSEDLRRRGSVDERAMSMSTGVRLFVANPDLDD
jgi:hypothetical protein